MKLKKHNLKLAKPFRNLNFNPKTQLRKFMANIFDGLITEKKYMKLKEGDNKFRILKEPITGWIDWKDKKPYRYRRNNRPSLPFDDTKPIKPFLACYVWDYGMNDLFILELTQATVLKSLKSLLEAEEWGPLTDYDIKVKKSGTGPLTKYLVEPVPPKPLAAHIKKAMETRPVNLEALYDGSDPWALGALESTISPPVDSEDPFEVIDDPGANKGPFDMIPLMTPYEELREHLQVEGIETDRLEEWIKARAQTKNETAEAVIKACLAREILPKFKRAFAKYIAPLDEIRT